MPGSATSHIKDGVPGGPIAKNHGDERIAGAGRGARAGPGRRRVLRRRQGSRRPPSSPGSARTRIGRGARPDRRRASSSSAGSSTSRCSSTTRTPRRSTSATTRSRCRRAGSRRWRRRIRSTIKAWQYDIVCNGVELSSGAIRNHRPDIMYKAFEIAGYSQRRGRARFRRHDQRLQVRRAAARRLGARRRPHRHAAGRRAEHPRGHRLPDEPEGRGPDDGRAFAGEPQAAARTADPAGGAAPRPESFRSPR